MIRSRACFVYFVFFNDGFFCVFHLREGTTWITQQVNSLLGFVWGSFCSYMRALKVFLRIPTLILICQWSQK